MVSLIFTIIIIAVIVWLLLWLIDYVEIIPAPFNKIIKILIVAFAVLYIISLLLPLIGIGGGAVKSLNLN